MLFFILIGIISLFGCKEELTDDYLIEHPHILENETIQCQTNPQAQCQMILPIMNEFLHAQELHYSYPEKFGEIIMRTQTEDVRVEKNLFQIQKKKMINQDELKQEQKNRDLLQKRLKIFMSILRDARSENVL